MAQTENSVAKLNKVGLIRVALGYQQKQDIALVTINQELTEL